MWDRSAEKFPKGGGGENEEAKKSCPLFLLPHKAMPSRLSITAQAHSNPFFTFSVVAAAVAAAAAESSQVFVSGGSPVTLALSKPSGCFAPTNAPGDQGQAPRPGPALIRWRCCEAAAGGGRVSCNRKQGSAPTEPGAAGSLRWSQAGEAPVGPIWVRSAELGGAERKTTWQNREPLSPAASSGPARSVSLHAALGEATP